MTAEIARRQRRHAVISLQRSRGTMTAEMSLHRRGTAHRWTASTEPRHDDRGNPRSAAAARARSPVASTEPRHDDRGNWPAGAAENGMGFNGAAAR